MKPRLPDKLAASEKGPLGIKKNKKKSKKMKTKLKNICINMNKNINSKKNVKTLEKSAKTVDNKSNVQNLAPKKDKKIKNKSKKPKLIKYSYNPLKYKKPGEAKLNDFMTKNLSKKLKRKIKSATDNEANKTSSNEPISQNKEIDKQIDDNVLAKASKKRKKKSIQVTENNINEEIKNTSTGSPSKKAAKNAEPDVIFSDKTGKTVKSTTDNETNKTSTNKSISQNDGIDKQIDDNVLSKASKKRQKKTKKVTENNINKEIGNTLISSPRNKPDSDVIFSDKTEKTKNNKEGGGKPGEVDLNDVVSKKTSKKLKRKIKSAAENEANKTSTNKSIPQNEELDKQIDDNVLAKVSKKRQKKTTQVTENNISKETGSTSISPPRKKAKPDVIFSDKTEKTNNNKGGGKTGEVKLNDVIPKKLSKKLNEKIKSAADYETNKTSSNKSITQNEEIDKQIDDNVLAKASKKRKKKTEQVIKNNINKEIENTAISSLRRKPEQKFGKKAKPDLILSGKTEKTNNNEEASSDDSDNEDINDNEKEAIKDAPNKKTNIKENKLNYEQFLDSDDDDDDSESEDEIEVNDNKTKEMYYDSTIFVGNVKLGIDEKKIKQQFSKYGTILAIRFRSLPISDQRLSKRVAIIKNKLHSARNTCNAYVRFSKASEAQAALAENGKVLEGLHLRVDMSKSKTTTDKDKTVYIGNLDFQAEDEDLWEAFSPCGNIESIRIVRDGKTNVSLGFAYVNFTNSDSVQLAMQMGEVKVKKRVVRVSNYRVQKKKKRVRSKGDKDKIVFVENIGSCDKDSLQSAFQTFGNIKKIRVPQQQGNAFLTFQSADAAKKAIDSMTHEIDGTTVKISKPQKVRKFLKKLTKSISEEHNNKNKKGKSEYQGFTSDKSTKKKHKTMNNAIKKKKLMIKQVAPKAK